jgi:hypothetical protein
LARSTATGWQIPVASLGPQGLDRVRASRPHHATYGKECVSGLRPS